MYYDYALYQSTIDLLTYLLIYHSGALLTKQRVEKMEDTKNEAMWPLNAS